MQTIFKPAGNDEGERVVADLVEKIMAEGTKESAAARKLSGWANRPDAKRVHRDNTRAFLRNLEGIAAGDVVVVGGLGGAAA